MNIPRVNSGDHWYYTAAVVPFYAAVDTGAIYVVDRGYVDFARLYVLHQAGAFFVTRAKSNIDAHRVYSAPTDRSTGIICDQTISLDGFYTRQDYPELLRRIRFKGPESYTLLQILSVTLFEKMPIHQALAGDENRCNASQITNQLNLFDF